MRNTAKKRARVVVSFKYIKVHRKCMRVRKCLEIYQYIVERVNVGFIEVLLKIISLIVIGVASKWFCAQSFVGVNKKHYF